MRRCVPAYKAMKGDVADSPRATSDGVWQKKHSGCGRMRTGKYRPATERMT
jgi:hypothetical protein